MNRVLQYCTIVGALSALIYLAILFKIIKFIKWWPSGWIISILIVIFISSKKVRLIYLRKKYGPSQRTKLVKSHVKVYVVLDNKIRKWLKNPKTLRELGWEPDQIKVITRKNLKKYKEKWPISV